MIKVMHIISDVKIGGAGRWLLYLLKEIDRKRVDITVVLPRNSLLKQPIEAMDFKTIEVDGMADKSLDAAMVKVLHGIFKREKPRIVHTHASLSARIAAKLAGVKAIVLTKHCIDHPKAGVKKQLGALVNKALCSKVIAVSKAVRQNVIDSGMPDHMVETIYSGIDELREYSAEERKAARKKWGLDEDDLVVGIVARLAEVKGHAYFIQAADRISKKIENARFLIVGGGPKEQELKEMVKTLGLERQVVFTGFMEDITEAYNMLDINVITSLSEALCLTLIEGMSIGKPCIGTNTGGIPEVIQEGLNGFIVPVKDADALADAVMKLASDQWLSARMGQYGKQWVQQNFQGKAMARKIEQIYEGLINS